MLWVYFALSYQPGLVHTPGWFGTLDDTAPFQGQVVIGWFNDKAGVAYGKCSATVFFAYQQALQNAGQSARLVSIPDINAATDASLW